MNINFESIEVVVADELGFVAFREYVLGDLREVLNRACDVLDTPDFIGELFVNYL